MIVASAAPLSEAIAHFPRVELDQVARIYDQTLSAPSNHAGAPRRLGVTNARSSIFALASTPLAYRGGESAEGHGGASHQFSSRK